LILHCTAKLAAKLPVVSTTPLAEDSPLGGWHGHLLMMERRQCVMLVHDATRYALFLPCMRKEQLADIAGWHRDLFLAALAAQGIPDATIGRVKLALGVLRCDRVTDRSVLGSLRVAADDLWWKAPDWGGVVNLDPLAVALWLNHRPTTIRGKSLWPEKDMAALVAGL
jgi:hypothetical protein